jgi:tripartite-type tricarboxylate transporter receptor subunit TctC
MHRRHLLAALAAAPLMPRAASAQADWPGRPVQIIVPFVAGGPSDIVARSIANRMAQAVGQPVVAENRPGAINAALRPNLGYDPIRDLSPITLAVTTPNVLVVNPEKVPVRCLNSSIVRWSEEPMPEVE